MEVTEVTEQRPLVYTPSTNPSESPATRIQYVREAYRDLQPILSS
jgi:hypothetical protein